MKNMEFAKNVSLILSGVYTVNGLFQKRPGNVFDVCI